MGCPRSADGRPVLTACCRRFCRGQCSCQGRRTGRRPPRASLPRARCRIHGNSALSPGMALRTEKAFDVSMDLLLRMQAWHEVTRMRARANGVAVEHYRPD